MAQITYADKTALNVNPEIADINKVKADDMNEIKSVVNENYSELSQLSTNVNGMITNEYSTSTTNTYSCGYINALHDFKYYYSNSDSGITITPTKDCLCEVEAIFSTWGFDGGMVTVSITIDNNPTTYFNYEGKGSNGNSVGRDVSARALFKLNAGTTYNINGVRPNSGGQDSKILIAKTIPLNE